MKSANKGFTLIELIIVIVILGILAVTASPKFLDLQGDAKASTVEGLEGSLSGAVNLVYAKALAQGKTGSNSATTSPAVNVKFGYPDATVTEMQAILEVNSAAAIDGSPAGADWEMDAIAASGSTPAQIKIYPVGTYDGKTTGIAEKSCYLLYTEAKDADTKATVSSVTSGC